MRDADGCDEGERENEDDEGVAAMPDDRLSAMTNTQLEKNTHIFNPGESSV